MKVGMIGFGNMGSAIVDGLLLKNIIEPENIYAYALNKEKLVHACKIRNINCSKNIESLVNNVDVVIISTPANLFKEIISSIKNIVKEKIVISVCSGSSYSYIKDECPTMHFISTIPSTPIRYGEGIVIAQKEHSLTKEDLEVFDYLFSKISLIKFMDENNIDVASTISGCGPSFAAMFIEALGDAGCKYGLSRNDSYELASKMLIGLGTSYLNSKKHPGILKDEVASPGGTTILGITKLEECGFRNALIKAIDAISNREK